MALSLAAAAPCAFAMRAPLPNIKMTVQEPTFTPAEKIGDYGFDPLGLGTAADHHVHHRTFIYNYGHTMMWWDQLAGTYREPELIRQFNKSDETTVQGSSDWAPPPPPPPVQIFASADGAAPPEKRRGASPARKHL